MFNKDIAFNFENLIKSIFKIKLLNYKIMKYIASLLLLPSIIFASSIGTNSIGFKVGQTNVGGEIDGVKGEWDGFGLELSGNFNITNQDKYGVDALFDATFGSGLEGPLGTESDVTKISGGLRPYMNLSGFVVFADIGFAHGEFEISGVDDASETSFAPGLGFELKLENLVIRPSVNWVEFGLGGDGTFFNLPISYSFNEKYDLTAKYDVASFDSENVPGLGAFNYIYDSITIGVDYKF
ncbi:MAG: hypothetical protein CMI19_04755 [Opitutae bacterium]|nr:hypothetical protein [Opitutae bacterium]|tara:strand:+ start:491 stop:1207 length:717 start_codon:yes stop_codon:yes gene_type:complete